jgi:DNA topoisomerase-1
VKLGRYGKFIGCPNYPECRYIRNMDGSERPEPEMLDEKCPDCGRQLQRRVGRYGPFVGCSGYPDCHYIKKDPPRTLGITCPQCNQGEIVEKRTRFGVFYGCDRYPDCDFAVNNEPLKEPRCPVDGSLLVQRPKSIRCWGCGAEFDLDMVQTKEGDPEAEAEARAAKSAARAARAAAKAAKKKPATRKKAAAKKKPAANKKTTTTKKRAATAKKKGAAAAEPASVAAAPSGDDT